MDKRLSLVAVGLACGVLGVLSSAQADQITLDAINGGISLAASGGNAVSVNISAPISGAGHFGGGLDHGTYTLGATSFTTGPLGSVAAEQYPAFGAAESFSYSGMDGDKLTGTLNWNFIQDNTNNPRFSGTMTVSSSSGDLAFTNAFAKGSTGHADFTTTGIPGGITLDALVAAGGHATVGVSSGEVVGVPGPVVGAGLPGVVAACGGLLMLARRRRDSSALVWAKRLIGCESAGLLAGTFLRALCLLNAEAARRCQKQPADR
jgi:hypothetical protein